MTQSPSPNFNGRGGAKIEMCVIHCTDGNYPSDLSWLRNPESQVSSHYLIAPSGEVHAMVAENMRAWCNGRVDKPTAKLKKNLLGGYINPNDYTVSIEVSMRATNHPTGVQYSALRDLVRDICVRNNIPIDTDHIIPHKAIYSLKTCPGTINVEQLVAELAPGEEMVPVLVPKSKLKRVTDHLLGV